jgi:hypothetical protein
MKLKVAEESYLRFVYLLNFIIRNVLPCRDVGEVFNAHSIKEWTKKNNLSQIFSLTSRQVLNFDLVSLSNHCDLVVGIDPFNGMDVNQIGSTLSVVDRGRLGCLLAIPTSLHHEVRPRIVYSVDEWCEILSQIGQVINRGS